MIGDCPASLSVQPSDYTLWLNWTLEGKETQVHFTIDTGDRSVQSGDDESENRAHESKCFISTIHANKGVGNTWGDQDSNEGVGCSSSKRLAGECKKIGRYEGNFLVGDIGDEIYDWQYIVVEMNH
ncbi:hypothetical protein ARMGADRAFT_1034158 [Armillaria gallica]|uniref:Uncharacterized protein n=1 Tax=Armillaria gallica TaxID=47427 RepID=A0A2H3CYR3_ARMGA|nr:hypothetical protein ARMGADRAFT_1034158 [Armillaria gallica]